MYLFVIVIIKYRTMPVAYIQLAGRQGCFKATLLWANIKFRQIT